MPPPETGLDEIKKRTRWFVLQKARRHPRQYKYWRDFDSLWAKWFQVLFHRPQRAAFNLSLTVLVHYR